MRESDPLRWTHPATILVATDLSDLDHLMPFALEQAGETGARLIFLHCCFRLPASLPTPPGCPTTTLPVPSKLRKRCCGHGVNRRRTWHPVRQSGARGPPHTADCSRRPPISGRPRAARDTEPEQDGQVAHWLRGRTSAALGLPPGHYRGTRGSSPGGRRRNVSSCMPPH